MCAADTHTQSSCYPSCKLVVAICSVLSAKSKMLTLSCVLTCDRSTTSAIRTVTDCKDFLPQQACLSPDPLREREKSQCFMHAKHNIIFNHLIFWEEYAVGKSTRNLQFLFSLFVNVKLRNNL